MGFKKLFVSGLYNSRSCFQPAVVAGPLTSGFEHVTLATKIKVSTGKVKYVYANILKGSDKTFDYHFKPWLSLYSKLYKDN